MATWVELIPAGPKHEPIAINLDRAVSMKRVNDKTRIELEGDKSLESVSAILDLAKGASHAHRT